MTAPNTWLRAVDRPVASTVHVRPDSTTTKMADYTISPDQGMCLCGCGAAAPIAKRTCSAQGVRRGDQLSFVSGHNSRRPPDLSRFTVTASGCHEWTGPRNQKNYGRIQVNRVHRPVHVVVWEQANGPLPAGLHVDHQCHNHPCMFLDHLRLLTPVQNNRAKRNMKMTAELAEQIRVMPGTSRQVAEQFGISSQYVRDIRCGRRFRPTVEMLQDSAIELYAEMIKAPWSA